MKQFRRNVFRLARQNKGSFLGAVFIIAIGIFVYVAMMDTLRNLESQVEEYYERSAMADVFAQVSGIQREQMERLKEIPGIREVSGKMAEDMRILFEGQEEIVTVHLMSWSETDALNQISLQRERSDEETLYLGERMAGIYGLETGTKVTLLWNGRTSVFRYSGTCSAPDYIYSIPPGGAMVPDGEVYDIAVIGLAQMEELLGRRDTLSELGFQLADGYDYEDVENRLARELESCGLISMTDRENQTSCHMVEGEIGELITMGTILPALFMAISIFMLYVVLKKMIDRDQSLIGAMKAFGLTDRELMGAYLAQGAAAGAVGAVLGSILAAPLGMIMFRMYAEFFNLPDTVYHSYWDSRLSAVAIALVTGETAVFLGVRDILSIAPAQAMRPKTPKAAAVLPLPDWLSARLGPLEKMAVRSIARNPFRGFLIVLAVAFPFSMASVLFSFDEVADQMFLDQFEKVQVYDFQVSLDGYENPARAAESGRFLPGVEEAEAVCTLSASLRRDSRSEFVVLYGLNPGSNLWKIKDSGGGFYEPPDGGLILNSRIAGKLHVSVGETVELSCPGVTAEPVKAEVVQIIDEAFGSGCYISIDSISRLLPTEMPANHVLLKVKDGWRDRVKAQLMDTSRVKWLVDGGKIVKSYEDLMISMMAMVQMFAFLSVAAGGVLIYNISMINIRDRMTEFGTLMVLGESEREMGRLLSAEQGLYFAMGILAGIPGSWLIRWLIEMLIVSENYTINMTIHADAYLTAFVICLLITAAAWAAQRRFVNRIELTEILKERE